MLYSAVIFSGGETNFPQNVFCAGGGGEDRINPITSPFTPFLIISLAVLPVPQIKTFIISGPFQNFFIHPADIWFTV